MSGSARHYDVLGLCRSCILHRNPYNIIVYTVTSPFLVEVNYHRGSAFATARSVARIGISDDDEWRHLVTGLALYVAIV